MMVCDSRSVCLSVLQRASVQSCTEGLKTCLVVGYDIPIRSKDSLSVEISINMRRRAHYIISTESRGHFCVKIAQLCSSLTGSRAALTTQPVKTMLSFSGLQTSRIPGRRIWAVIVEAKTLFNQLLMEPFEAADDAEMISMLGATRQ